MVMMMMIMMLVQEHKISWLGSMKLHCKLGFYRVLFSPKHQTRVSATRKGYYYSH